MNLDPAAIRPDVIALVPESLCRRYRVLPVDRIENSLMLAMADPTNVSAMDDIKFLTGFDVVPIASTEAAVADAIDRIVWSDGSVPEHAEPPVTEAGDADDMEVIEYAPDEIQESPVVRAVNELLLDAIAQDATDVHITPGETGIRIGYRIEGVFHEASVLPLKLRDALVSRLKIMAHLDIAERRLPQDGRLTIQLREGPAIPIRLATLPTASGERITMRIERADLRPRTVDELGLPQADLERLMRAVRTDSGLVLIAGGARSGRTTTLYALLRHLNDGTRAILTVEDPVQQQIDGVAQTEVRTSIGYTAAAAIRGMLRHDPDLIMVQRIDGEETASLLTAAAQNVTVLTSIDAEGAPETLIELARLAGGAAAVVSSARFVMAQRLLRRHLFAELMEVSPAIRKALSAGADPAELRRIAVSEGMSPFPVPER